MRHAKKSQMLTSSNLGCDFAEARQLRGEGSRQSMSFRKVVSLNCDYEFSQYASVMVDLMNHICPVQISGPEALTVAEVILFSILHYLKSQALLTAVVHCNSKQTP